MGDLYCIVWVGVKALLVKIMIYHDTIAKGALG